MALNIKTLTTRTLTAIIFVAVLLSSICFNYLSFVALFFIVSIWGLYEFYLLSEKLGVKPYKSIGIISGIVFFLYGILSNSNLSIFFSSDYFLPLGVAITFGIFIFGLFDSSENNILKIAYTLMGIVYAVVPFILLINIACINKGYIYTNQTNSWYNNVAPYNFHYVLGTILLIWASDSGAYLIGSLIGKHKLFERISPGKTWEGTIGATVLTVFCAFIISNWFPELALIHWIVIAIIVSVIGTVGDLVESMFKRKAGIKDSGKIMPGHGGILDRFDSLLFVSPFIYAYLKIVL